MSLPKVIEIFNQSFQQTQRQKRLIAPEDLPIKDGKIDITLMFQAFWDFIEPPLFNALAHLESRIDDLEARLPEKGT